MSLALFSAIRNSEPGESVSLIRSIRTRARNFSLARAFSVHSSFVPLASPEAPECFMRPSHPIVFLVDVDNTLVDNDGIQQDLKDHLERTYGVAARDRYWRILEDLMVELGYRDYIGALQRFRVEHPREIELLSMSSFLMDYPFADRLYPHALAVLERLRRPWPDRDPVRRRCRLPAAQGRACRAGARRSTATC